MSWRVFKGGFIDRLIETKRLPSVPEIKPIHLPTKIKIMTKNKEEFKRSIYKSRRIGVVDRYTRSNQKARITSARSASPFNPHAIISNIEKANVLLPPLSRV